MPESLDAAKAAEQTATESYIACMQNPDSSEDEQSSAYSCLFNSISERIACELLQDPQYQKSPIATAEEVGRRLPAQLQAIDSQIEQSK